MVLGLPIELICNKYTKSLIELDPFNYSWLL